MYDGWIIYYDLDYFSVERVCTRMNTYNVRYVKQCRGALAEGDERSIFDISQSVFPNDDSFDIFRLRVNAFSNLCVQPHFNQRTSHKFL